MVSSPGSVPVPVSSSVASSTVAGLLRRCAQRRAARVAFVPEWER